jgi:MFS family permease
MLVGLVVLTVSVAWTGVATSIDQVIVSRLLAGVGAALLFPGTLATITAAVPAGQRQLAVGLWAISIIIGGVAGLLICAVGVEFFSWQEPFLLIAGITAVLVVLTALTVPETKAEHDVGLDPVGALTSIGAVGGLTFAVTEGPVHGWLGTTTLVAGGIGAVLAVVFVRWELRQERPLLDVRLFLDGRFGSASAALFAIFFAHFSLFFLAFQYQGYVLGSSTLESALGAMPPVLGFALTPVGPLLARRIGRRRVIVGAALLCATGAALAVGMAMAGTATYWTFALGAGVMWCGIGLAMAPPTEMIIESVPREKQGVASAVNDLSRELAAAVGIAVTGSAFNTAYRASVDDRLTGVPDGLAGIVLDSPAAAIEALGQRPGGDATLAVVRDGVLDGWIWGFAIIAVVLLLGAAVTWSRCPDLEEERSQSTALDEEGDDPGAGPRSRRAPTRHGSAGADPGASSLVP